MVVRIGGVIDVDHGSDGAADGNDLYGFGNEFTLPFSTRFSPSAANCSAVFGSLNGPVEYGTETDGDASYFMAVRAGSAPGSVDVQGQLAELLDEAGFVLNMDPLYTDVLRRFVGDMLAFESMLASLEACDPAQELDMGPAWDMLQSVTFNTVRTFLDAAGRGAYTTRDVIDVLGVWLQGGSLGWRAAECLDVNTDLEGALDLFVIFEDVLLDRLGQLSDAPDGDHDAATDRAAIAAAAYQYGLQRVIAALEGR
jgi:hypothetical protein